MDVATEQERGHSVDATPQADHRHGRSGDSGGRLRFGDDKSE